MSVASRVCAAPSTVLRVTPICDEHVEIEARLDAFPPSVPGQFLQLHCAQTHDDPPHAIDWPSGGLPHATGDEFRRDEAFLRRPFSIADRFEDDAGHTHLVVISRTIGPGTAYLSRLRTGDTLDLTGPLGRGFALPDLRETPLLLVGGGVGIPPLIYLSRVLDEQGWPDVTLIFGAMRRQWMPLVLRDGPTRDGTPRRCVETAGRLRHPAILTTDDGTLGLPGRVTDGIEAWRRRRGEAAKALVFACGPEPMLHAVARQTRELGYDCQLCIERMMGCGLGTCLSCVVKVVDTSRPAGWRWALSCGEGPVFERDRLLET